MSQEHIDFTVPGGDDVTTALHKAEDNFTDLYGQMAANAAAVVPYGGLRNLLINGDGRVNQRVFAGGSLAANKYGYDRWRALGAASSMTVGAATIALQGTNCQIIETPDLANATVTVSVSNPSGPITVALQPDGTTATSATGIIPAGAGIQKVTLTVPGTLTGNVFVLLTAAGAVTVDGPSKRAGIQVECGSVASPFERRHLLLELMMCQRYYEKRGFYQNGYANSGGSWATDIPFAVVKRAPPSIIWTSASYANASGIGVPASDPERFVAQFTITAAGNGLFVGSWAADAEL